MMLKDCQIGDRVRVWYDGTSIVELINSPNNHSHSLEATIGSFDTGAGANPDVALVWKPGEYTPNAWSLATSRYSWAPPLITRGYEKGFWASSECECEMIRIGGDLSIAPASQQEVVSWTVAKDVPINDVVLPPPTPQEETFDFDAYNYGTKKS
jgi:hypothetical protein